MQELVLIENPEYQFDNPLADDFGLDDYDDEPYDFDDMMALEKNKPKLRRNPKMEMENPLEGMTAGTIAVLGGLGYLLWCAIIYSKTKIWTWKPWTAPAIERSRQLAMANAIAARNNHNSEDQRITLIVP